jgi:alpha-amylase
LDRYTRVSLLDHFLAPSTTVENYAINNYVEIGDFVEGEYLVQKALVSDGQAFVEMTRMGQIAGINLTVKKTIRFGMEARLAVNYEFMCHRSEPTSILYGCEFNLNLYSDQDPKRYYFVPDANRRREVSETGQEGNLKRFVLVNESDQMNAAFAISHPVSVWFFPLMTVSQSEEGFERTYQGSSLLFLHPLELTQGQNKKLQIILELVTS